MEKKYVYSFQIEEEGYIEKVPVDFTPWSNKIQRRTKWRELFGPPYIYE